MAVIKMDIVINRAGSLRGMVTVPGSKSYTHRVIAAAALSDSETLVRNPSDSEANRSMIGVCKRLGADITWEGPDLRIRGVGGKPKAPGDIHMGNSGTALRIAISLSSLGTGRTVLDGDDSLRSRPTGELIKALNQLGASISGTQKDAEAYAPIRIDGCGLRGGSVHIAGDQSSQYITSLLMVSSLAQNDVEITVEGTVVSQPYIMMTLEVLERFGVLVEHSPDCRRFHTKVQPYASPGTYKIPGDYSQAAFFLAAGCLLDSDITIAGPDPDDAQGDKAIVDILYQMGAKIERDGDRYRVRGPFELRGVEVDLLSSPDLFPVLAVVGAYASGKTRLYNMPQIRTKETDRIAVIEREFARCGIRTESGSDELTIHHSEPRCKTGFDARGAHGVSDHRVAMALSLIGLRSGPCTLYDARSVAVSYPRYFDDLAGLGADVQKSDDKQ